jgi:hypothetical protein
VGLVLPLDSFGFSKTPPGQSELAALTMTVRVFNSTNALSNDLASAQSVAATIFRRAGIELLWLDCSLSSEGIYSDVVCDQSSSPITLIIRIVSTSPATKMNFGRDTLGIAAGPEAGTAASAAVFYDRVMELAQSGLPLAAILGHAMAHEIGHLLLGSNSHSSTGLMRAKWWSKDLKPFSRERLFFSLEQAELIRKEVLKRMRQGEARRPNAPSKSVFADSQTRSRPKINVRVYNYAHVTQKVLAGAEQEATIIFRQARLEMVWLDCPLSMAEFEKYPDCQQPSGRVNLALRILPRAMAESEPSSNDTLGYALPGSAGAPGRIANVFYHRVEELARKAQGLEYQILGNIMAHEIGHLLLGSTGHSPTGIMKAKWSREELQPSSVGSLVFTPQQATLIQNGVANRVRQKESSAFPAQP